MNWIGESKYGSNITRWQEDQAIFALSRLGYYRFIEWGTLTLPVVSGSFPVIHTSSMYVSMGSMSGSIKYDY